MRKHDHLPHQRGVKSQYPFWAMVYVGPAKETGVQPGVHIFDKPPHVQVAWATESLDALKGARGSCLSVMCNGGCAGARFSPPGASLQEVPRVAPKDA